MSSKQLCHDSAPADAWYLVHRCRGDVLLLNRVRGPRVSSVTVWAQWALGLEGFGSAQALFIFCLDLTCG